MRLCYYGHFDLPSDCENWIANALSRAGVLVYRWQRKVRNIHTLLNDDQFREFVFYLKGNNIDVVLLNKAPEFKEEWISDLFKLGIKVVWWTFDYMAEPGLVEWFIPLARKSDLCFMTDGSDADDFYKDNGLKRIELHQGFDPDIHCTDMLEENEGECGNEIVFLGSSYTSRRHRLINFLELNYGKRFTHYGKHNALRDGLWGGDFRKAMFNSKIIIGDNFRNDIIGYWSDRVYLTLACNAFFLTSYVTGLEKEFENEKHLVWYYDFAELKDKIDYYLENEEERKYIAQKGNDLVRKRDTYDHRIKIFLKHLKGIMK